MRVLFTSIAGLGHVHPMVPLARALQERGHEIRWLTGPDGYERLRSIGIAADSVGVSFEELRAEYRRRYPEAAAIPPAQMADHVFPRLFGEIVAPQIVHEAIRIVREWPAHLLVNDAGELGGPIAAAYAGIPAVTHGFGALTPIHRVKAAEEAVGPLWRSVGLEPRPFCGLYDHLYLDIYPPSLQVANMTHVPSRHLVRPVPFDDAGDETSWLPPDPLDDAPLVYLTMGTVPRENLVLRAALDAIAAQHVRVLMTVGPSGDPTVFGAQPDHVHVERYVPQTRVLRHCAVVVSHAGSGTFLATLGQGVPQLCLPQMADQFLNANACRRSGVGLVLDPEDATAAAISEAVARLLAEDSYRERAVGLATEIAAMPDPRDVVPVLEGLQASA